MKIYVVRHGQTNYNLEFKWSSDPAAPVRLTEKGVEQAQVVAEKLRDVPLDIIYISDLPRTRETAEIINRYHNALLKVDTRLSDRKTGFEGITTDEWFRLLAQADDKWNVKYNDGESFEEEKKQVHSFLEDLRQQPYKVVVIVTHGEAINIINGYFHNLANEDMHKGYVDNCQVLEFRL